MENTRRKQASYDAGVSSAALQKKIDEAREKENKRRIEKDKKRVELKNNSLYNLMVGAKRLFDDYYLDAIIGLFPGVGDFITSAAALPSLLFCMFKVRSLPLTLAVINNIMIDAIIGLIPFWIGNIADIFYRAHRKNLDLIVGYIEDDQNTIDTVNRKAVGAAFMLAFLIFALVMIIKLVIYLATQLGNLWDWFIGLF